MAFTAAGGGAQLPPVNFPTAGDLRFTGRQQNRTKNVHSVHSNIHNVLGTTGTSFKSITSSPSHSSPDRKKKILKTRKNHKSSLLLLSSHTPESESSLLATPGTSCKFPSSSSPHPSSDRFEKSPQTGKYSTPSSRVLSPTRSATDVAVLPTGNVVEQQRSFTDHQPLPDLSPSPSGTSVNEQRQLKPRYEVITTAATIHGLAGTLLPSLAPSSPVSMEAAGLLSAKPSADVSTVAARVSGHAGASSSAGAAKAAAGATESVAVAAGSADIAPDRPPMITAAAKLHRAGTNHAETATVLAAAAGAKLLPGLATPAHASAVLPSALPATSNAAKGNENLELQPALILRTLQNPNPISLPQTRIQDPYT